jgi:hypothetical protein
VIRLFRGQISGKFFMSHCEANQGWSGWYFFDPHPSNSISEILAVNAVAIAQQIPGSLIIGECFDDLLRRPLSRRMRCNIEVDDLTSVMQ